MAAGFVLCADDFALTRGVSRSILTLLERGRLTATGAMTNRPHWRDFAGELMAFSGRADLGVHLNLTCAQPLTSMPRLASGGELPKLGQLAKAALISGEARREIAAEIAAQIDSFSQISGRPPDFIDGHQHAHVLPGVRGAVLEAISKRFPKVSVYLRDPSDSVTAIRQRGVATGKALTIALLAAGLAGQASRRGIRVNRGFSGVAPFDPERDFAADLGRFLIAPGPAHLVMCHPGFIDDELLRLDPVIATRPIEHEALMAFSPAEMILRRFAELAPET